MRTMSVMSVNRSRIVRFPKRALALLLSLAVSGSALAGGSHAGGHGHGHGVSASDETAIGRPGQADRVDRTVSVEMRDTLRYTPAEIEVREGETVRFVVKNLGQVKHEMSLGTDDDLLAHLEVMKRYPDMVHEEPNQISLAPGETGEILWQFTRAGMVPFACLVPGHYEGGMIGAVKVVKP